MRSVDISVGLLAAAAIGAIPAQAQQGGGSQTAAYEAAYFAGSSPRNALDMARQVPGFALDLGSTDTRGFAGAAGNVVINGARPSSKSETLQSLLARIPADRVVRVEVGPGSLFGSDYAGKSQVLNLVLSREAGIDGSVTVQAIRLYDGTIQPNLSATALIKRGDSTISLSAGRDRGFDSYNDEGIDLVIDAQSGDLIEYRRKHNRRDDRIASASASWALEKAPDEAYRLNARFSREKYRFRQKNHVRPAAGDIRDDRQSQDLLIPEYELGGDITQPLAGGAIKMVGLLTRRNIDNRDLTLNRVDEEVIGGFEQVQDQQKNETIGRINWTRADWGGLSVEAGFEVALNKFRSNAELFDLGADGSKQPIDLPIDHATVREKRGEAFLRLGRQLSPKLRVDGGLAAEFSRLRVSGDTSADRSLRFLKPNVELDWKPGGGWHGQVSLRRTVAQLNFFDFISAADFISNNVSGGNADLQPQRAWEVRATVDRPLLGTGLVRLELGHDRISLLQDRILTDEGFDAPGNIGTGKRSFATLTLDAPLAAIGLKGARLKLTGTVQRTRVDDPINGEPRNFSGPFPDRSFSADYRHDLGKFSFGFTASQDSGTTLFRTDEFDNFRIPHVLVRAFAEYRPTARSTIRLDVNNLTDIHAVRRRTFFVPNRTDPVPDTLEQRRRNGHASFALSFKQSFGG